MKLCYLAHPVDAPPGREQNAQAALALLRRLNSWHVPGRLFCAPWLATVLSGEPEGRREDWLKMDCRLVQAHDELWLTGPEVTAGMKREAAAFRGPTFRLLPGEDLPSATRVDVRLGKDSAGKSRVGLIPPLALLEVGHVLGFGKEKHGEAWRDTPPEIYAEAATRHILLDASGERLDEETGRLHLAHGAADLLLATELRRVK